MHTSVDDVHTLDDLRSFIHQTLCQKENLLADQFGMTDCACSATMSFVASSFVCEGLVASAWRRSGRPIRT